MIMMIGQMNERAGRVSVNVVKWDVCVYIHSSASFVCTKDARHMSPPPVHACTRRVVRLQSHKAAAVGYSRAAPPAAPPCSASQVLLFWGAKVSHYSSVELQQHVVCDTAKRVDHAY